MFVDKNYMARYLISSFTTLKKTQMSIKILRAISSSKSTRMNKILTPASTSISYIFIFIIQSKICIYAINKYIYL